MKFINKLGVVFMIIAASHGWIGTDSAGWYPMVLFYIGAALFLIPDGIK